MPELASVKKSFVRHVGSRRRQTPGRLSLAGQVTAVLLKGLCKKHIRRTDKKAEIANNLALLEFFLNVCNIYYLACIRTIRGITNKQHINSYVKHSFSTER